MVRISRSILPQFEALEEQKRKLLLDIERLSIDRLSFRPEPGSWCILQMLDHLVKVEESMLGAVRRNIPKNQAPTLRDRMGAMFIIAIMKSPMRVKVPGAASMVLPRPAVTLPEASAEWSRVRMQMAELVGFLPEDKLSTGLFRHPVSGWMNIAQSLQFLSAHIIHHEYQLKRLKK